MCVKVNYCVVCIAREAQLFYLVRNGLMKLMYLLFRLTNYIK